MVEGRRKGWRGGWTTKSGLRRKGEGTRETTRRFVDASKLKLWLKCDRSSLRT